MSGETDYVAKMKKRYAAMADAEAAFRWEFAHAFKGAEAFCTSCKRGPRHAFHVCPACPTEVDLSPDDSCPVCGFSA